ncbi:ABC transporter substrate-binding protein [Patulibacter sp.]|uniref:ABC transporter substrate-binding protein n=1 Tax=Patulibacter sp. TaxID=1912859 RepID=UPI0027157638|nr:ABC transporter substrate-binding protein [Patulibacter sp.]MDO9409017.1 ABC transporter substrate-binding protein [Patulibacter sp.]
MPRTPSLPKGRPAASRVGLAILSLTAATGLAACGSGGSAGGGSEASAKTLETQTWLVPQDWGALDPTRSTATNSGTILLAFEPLVLSDGKGGAKPNIATQTTPDAKTFIYKIRSGVTFSDGKPLTIEDVLYSIDIHRRKGSTSALAGNFTAVRSIKATGPDEITIKMRTPDVLFANTMAQTGIVEKAVREPLGKGAGAPDKPNVGTGPFTIAKFQPGKEVVLQRNERYWGTKPAAKQLTMRLVADESARLLAVRAGDVTGAFEVPASEAAVYAKVPGMTLIRGNNPSITTLSLNQKHKPWNDVHVRRAVAHAVDRPGLVKAILRGNGSPSTTLVQPANAQDVMPAAEQERLYASLDLYKPDMAAAKAEMAKSTVPGGFKDTIVFSDAEPGQGRVAQAIAQELKAIGIDLTVKQTPDEAYTEAVFFKHTASAAVVDFTTDQPDPISLPNYMSSKKQTLAEGGYTNIADYVNPAQDAVLDEYLATPATDSKKRAELLSSALTNLATDEPYVPLYNSNYIAIVKSGLKFADFDGMWWMRRWTDGVTASK